MIVDLAILISALTTLIVVIDPIGQVPVFVALTQNMSAKPKRKIATRACGVAIGILLTFVWLGGAVLDFFGISLSAFRIAGGILLFLTALEMLFELRSKRRQSNAEDDDFEDPSVFPLAIPFIAGPGAIAAIILLNGEFGPEWPGLLVLSALVMSSVFICWLLLLTSAPIERMLGKFGIQVATRLLGMLLAALAVQFVIDGFIGLGIA